MFLNALIGRGTGINFYEFSRRFQGGKGLRRSGENARAIFHSRADADLDTGRGATRRKDLSYNGVGTPACVGEKSKEIRDKELIVGSKLSFPKLQKASLGQSLLVESEGTGIVARIIFRTAWNECLGGCQTFPEPALHPNISVVFEIQLEAKVQGKDTCTQKKEG